MYLVDVNVLVNAVNRDASHHEAARRWLENELTGHETVAFTWIVLVAFIRVTTQPRLRTPLPTRAAVRAAEAWLAAPAAVLVDPGPGHLDRIASLLEEAGVGGNLVTDAQLAAIALEYDATVVTFDGGFDRFSGVRTETPS